MRSPLPTDWPVRATSPLTFTMPCAMRSSSARREPRPACASTLCRRSSMRALLASSLPFAFSDRVFFGVSLISQLRLGIKAGLVVFFVVDAGRVFVFVFIGVVGIALDIALDAIAHRRGRRYRRLE